MSLSLSKRTHDILSNFAAINPSLQFREGNVLKTMSPARDVMAVATVPEVFPKEFAIYDISRFLGAASLFESPTFKFDEKFLTIESENRKIKYVYASPTMIIAPKKDEDVTNVQVVSSFDLPSKILVEVSKALSLLKLPDVMIVANGQNIKIEAKESKSKENSADSYVSVMGQTDANFVVVLKAEKLQKLIPDDYKVLVRYQDGAGLTTFESKDIKYHITCEAGSRFNV